MSVIKITQVIDDSNLNEIVTLETDNDIWERLHRIFPNHNNQTESLQVWVDLLSDDGADIIDDPVSMSASQGRWFLKDFCHRPKKEWVKIKQG